MTRDRNGYNETRDPEELVQVISQEFNTIDSLVEQDFRESKPLLLFWYDPSKESEDEDLTFEQLKEQTNIKYRSLISNEEEVPRDVLERFFKTADPQYVPDEKFKPTIENPYTDEELILLSRYEWLHHLGKLEQERRRITDEEANILHTILVLAGTIPDDCSFEKFWLGISISQDKFPNKYYSVTMDGTVILNPAISPLINQASSIPITAKVNYGIGKNLELENGDIKESVYLQNNGLTIDRTQIATINDFKSRSFSEEAKNLINYLREYSSKYSGGREILQGIDERFISFVISILKRSHRRND